MSHFFSLAPAARLLLCSCVLLCCLVASGALPVAAQSGSLFSIPIHAKWMATDKLQQLYVVTTANEVIKYLANGQEQYRFSNNILGALTHLDATDPFNLLLYYFDYQTVVLLDRTLNKTAEYKLTNAGFAQVRTVGTSNDGAIWVYDEAAFRLYKIDRQAKILHESPDLSLLLGQAPQPTQLLARDNWVYMSDPQLGILVFDNFGQYAKTLDIKGVSQFQIIDNRLVFREGAQLQIADLQSFQYGTMALPEAAVNAAQVLVHKNRLYIRDQVGIIVQTF